MTARTFTPAEADAQRLATALAARDAHATANAAARKALEAVKVPADQVGPHRRDDALAICDRIDRICGEVTATARRRKCKSTDFALDCDWIESLNHSIASALAKVEAAVAEIG